MTYYALILSHHHLSSYTKESSDSLRDGIVISKLARPTDLHRHPKKSSDLLRTRAVTSCLPEKTSVTYYDSCVHFGVSVTTSSSKIAVWLNPWFPKSRPGTTDGNLAHCLVSLIGAIKLQGYRIESDCVGRRVDRPGGKTRLPRSIRVVTVGACPSVMDARYSLPILLRSLMPCTAPRRHDRVSARTQL